MGVARSKLEIHAHNNFVNFQQRSSCKFEALQVTIAKLLPEVKSADAVATFDCEALRIKLPIREVVQHSRMCVAMQELARN